MTKSDNKKCRVDIIGTGGLSLALIKKLASKDMEGNFSEINVWQRQSFQITDSGVSAFQKSSVNTDLFNIFRMFQFNGDKNNSRIHFRTFESLDDMRAISTESQAAAERGEKCLLVALSKYRLEELSYVDPQKKTTPLDSENPKHIALLAARMKTWLATTDYDRLEPKALKETVLRDRDGLLGEAEGIQDIIQELDKTTKVGYERLYTLKSSVLGVRELSKVLTGYPGTVLNMVNEVDTTNRIIMSVGGLSPEKVISPCEHDRIRAEYFLWKMLREQGVEVVDLHAEYVGPHNHTGFTPLESISWEFKDTAGKVSGKALRTAIRSSIKKSNGFGEQVFLSKGSSDEDSVEGIFRAVESFLMPGEKPFRASSYLHEHNTYSGLNGLFKEDGSFVVSDTFMDYAKQKSKERFLVAVETQRKIDTSLAGVIGEPNVPAQAGATLLRNTLDFK